MAAAVPKSPLIQHSDELRLGQIIGQGSISEICVAKHVSTLTEYVVKRACAISLSDNKLRLFQKEVEYLRTLKHENIVRMYGSCHSGRSVELVLRLMHHRSCADLLKLRQFHNGLPPEAVITVLLYVLRALKYLHQQRYVHRGVKGSHILLDHHGNVALSGFTFMTKLEPGSARILRVSDLDEMTANVHWLSPELLAQDCEGFDMNSDVYSVGITCCELINGAVPYADMSPAMMLVKKMEEPAPRLWDTTTSELRQDDYSADLSSDDLTLNRWRQPSVERVYESRVLEPHLHRLTAACLQRESRLRPYTPTLLEHPVFRDKVLPPETLLNALGLTNRQGLYFQAAPHGVLEAVAGPSRQCESSHDFDWNFD